MSISGARYYAHSHSEAEFLRSRNHQNEQTLKDDCRDRGIAEFAAFNKQIAEDFESYKTKDGCRKKNNH